MAKENAESLCQKAQQAIAEGRNEDARLFYQQALGLRSDHPEAHYGMATICFLLGDLANSAYHFKEVTRLDPLRAGAYINLGAVYNRLEQYEEAIAALRRGIQLDTNRGEGYYNLGLVHRKKGQVDMAIQAYREAVRVNPRMADAHYNLANLYLEKTQYTSAISHYRQALEVRPNWEKALRGLEHAEIMAEEAEDKGVPAHSHTSNPKPAAPTPRKLDPDRLVDPNVHGEMLRGLHRATVDSEVNGRTFLKILEEEIEPAIKELSTNLLYPDTSSMELDNCVQKFEGALMHMRQAREALLGSLDKVHALGDQLTQS
jgi:Flp pilus assembly protein TadD